MHGGACSRLITIHVCRQLLEILFTIEGLTSLSDGIDFGNYKIINDKINVSDTPGFGIILLK